MPEDDVILSGEEVEFLMRKFDTYDIDYAIECFIELLVLERVNPMDMKTYIQKLMDKEHAHC